MNKNLKVVEFRSSNEEKRAIIEEKMEFIKSVTSKSLIVLFAIFCLAIINIIPEINAYTALITGFIVFSVAIIAYGYEQIKLIGLYEEWCWTRTFVLRGLLSILGHLQKILKNTWKKAKNNVKYTKRKQKERKAHVSNNRIRKSRRRIQKH